MLGENVCVLRRCWTRSPATAALECCRDSLQLAQTWFWMWLSHAFPQGSTPKVVQLLEILSLEEFNLVSSLESSKTCHLDS